MLSCYRHVDENIWKPNIQKAKRVATHAVWTSITIDIAIIACSVGQFHYTQSISISSKADHILAKSSALYRQITLKLQELIKIN